MVEVYDPGTHRLGSKLPGGQGLPVHDSDQYPAPGLFCDPGGDFAVLVLPADPVQGCAFHRHRRLHPGMGCMAGADVLVGRHQGAGENKLVGDLLVLGGATLYGISNVWEEYIIRTLSRVEFLGMIGLFGAFFSGIQLAIMEHKELLKVPWDWQIGLLYVGFSACMFGLYSFMPVVIKKTSATSVNLSLLTADLYSLFCGLFLFHYKFSGLYLLSFFTILIGLVLYSSTSTYIAQDPRVYKQFRNPSGPAVDLPAAAQVEPSVTYTSLGQETEDEPHVRVA
uniref:Solute carrier family 35 member F1 n=1 Tax=Sus scrofa TaxID=9823 RepID=A0A4X1VN63_PIG